MPEAEGERMKTKTKWWNRILAGVLSAGIFLSAWGFVPHVHTHAPQIAEAAEAVIFSQAELNRLVYATGATQKNEISVLTENLEDEEFSLDITFDRLSMTGMAGIALGAVNMIAKKANPVIGFIASTASKVCATGTIVQTNKNIKNMLEEAVRHLDEKVDAVYEKLSARMDEQNTAFETFATALGTQFEQSKNQEALLEFAYDRANQGVFGKKIGGYFGWQKELFLAYQRVVNFSANENVSAEDLKTAYDYLYVVADYSTKVLYGYLQSGSHFGGKSIQDIVYDYYLLSAKNLGPAFGNSALAALEFVQDIYTTYYMAQVCLQLCTGYQISYLTEKWGEDYAVLKTKSYQLVDTITSDNRTLFYDLGIEVAVEEAADGIDSVGAELAAFYARVLNLDESYRYTPSGQNGVYEVGYEELFNEDGYRSAPVSVQGIGSTSATNYYYRKNNVVSKGDTLYLNTVPERLSGVFDLGFSFATSDPEIANVNSGGVVTVKGDAGQSFTVALRYAGKTVYSLDFTIGTPVLGGGMGTINAPYLISSAEEYASFAANSALHVKNCYVALAADIQNTSSSIENYYGDFNGRGFTITGASKPLTNFNYGKIYNVVIDQSSMVKDASGNSGHSHLGAIACENKDCGVIENCIVQNSEIRARVTGIFYTESNYYLNPNAAAGAIVGNNFGAVRGCSSVGNGIYAEVYAHRDNLEETRYFISNPTGYAGGLIGSNEAKCTISDNLSSGNRIASALTNTGYRYYKKHFLSSADDYSFSTTAYFRIGGLMGDTGTAKIERNVVNNNNYWSDWRPMGRGNRVDEARGLARKEERIGRFIGANDGATYVNCSASQNDNGGVLAFSNLSEQQREEYRNNGWEFQDGVPVRATLARSGLNVITMPTKITYEKGEAFNPAGIVLADDGGRIIKDFSVGRFDSSSFGTKTVAITSGDLGTEIEVTVRCAHRNVELVDKTDKLTEGYRCTECGEWALAPVEQEMHEHEWVISPATSTQHKKTCSICGLEEFENHKIGEYTVTEETHAGKCETCLDNVTQHHVWTERILKSPTCTEKGEKRLTCNFCPKTRTEEIEALGHTPASAVIEKMKAATCTERGSYEEVVYCAECGEEISRTPKNILPKGHTPLSPVRENVVAATCTEAGSYEEVTYCRDCEEELSREDKIESATGHTAGDPVREKEQAATCTEAGSYEEVVYCDECHAEISREKKEIPVKGHTAGDPVREKEQAATCTEAGSYEEVTYCRDCKAEVSREKKEIPAKGHNESAWILDYAPTETTAGSRHKECTECHKLLQEEEIPATGSGGNDNPGGDNPGGDNPGGDENSGSGVSVFGCEIAGEAGFAAGGALALVLVAYVALKKGRKSN